MQAQLGGQWSCLPPSLSAFPDRTGSWSSAPWDLSFLAAGERQGAGWPWSLGVQSGLRVGVGRWGQRARVGGLCWGVFLTRPSGWWRPGRRGVGSAHGNVLEGGQWRSCGQAASGAGATGAAAGLVIQQHRHPWATPQGPSFGVVNPSEGGVRCCGSLDGGEAGRDWLLRQGSQLKALEEGLATRSRLPQSSLNPACCGPGQRSSSRVLRPVPLGPGLFQASLPLPAPSSPGTHSAQGSLRIDLI